MKPVDEHAQDARREELPFCPPVALAEVAAQQPAWVELAGMLEASARAVEGAGPV